MVEKPKYPVGATNTSLDLIELLRYRGSAGITELADELEMAKSAVHKHLTTLESRGYVVKEDGQYQVGLKFLEIGGYLRNEMNLFRESVSEIRSLGDETGERVNLMVEEQGMGIYIIQLTGTNSVDMKTDYIGKRVHLHNTAIGKSLLAFASPDRVHSIIERHGLPRSTKHTITDTDELLSELEQVRERGYAIDDEERLLGLRCVGVPICEPDGAPIAAISISAPVSRLRGDRLHEEIPSKLRDSANIIELNASY